MTFTKDLKTKSDGFLATLEKNKAERAKNPPESLDDMVFMTSPGRTGDLQNRRLLADRVKELERQLEESASGLNAVLNDLVDVPGRIKSSGTQNGKVGESNSRKKIAAPDVIRSGAKTYCKIFHVEKNLVISFKAAEEHAAVEDAIRQVLKDRAASIK